MADKELEELEREALLEAEGGSDEGNEMPEPDTTPDDAEDQGADVDDEEIPENEENTAEEESTPDENQEEQEPDVEDEENIPDPKKDEDNKTSDNEFGIELKKPVKIKARGMEIDINDPKELVQLAHKGFDYFKKTQELAKWRKDIEVLNQGNISNEELQLLAEIKAGNKDAVPALLNQYGIDPLDIEPNNAQSYQPTQNYSQADYEVESVIENIKSDPELATEMSQLTANLPDDFIEVIGSDANKLTHFAEHVKTGLAQKAIPEALKLQALYGGSFLENYTRVGEAILAQQAQPNVGGSNRPAPKPAMSNRERELRRKASAPKKTSTNKRTFIQDAEEIWSMSEEDFHKAEQQILRELGR